MLFVNQRSLAVVSAFALLQVSSFGWASESPRRTSPGLCIPVLMDCTASGSGTVGATTSGLPGTWTQDSFSNSAGSRGYYLYVPKSAPSGKPTGLMVMLHGCFQDAVSFSRQTGMNVVAEKYGFAVIYPEQTYADNVWKCWNWFRPENQEHDSGELSIIVGMVKEVGKKVSFNTKKVYVAGLSAGAAMASNLVACHAEVFAGAGIHSGMEYAAATSEAEAHQVTRSGSTHDINESGKAAAACSGARVAPLAIVAIHGKADPFVNPVNSERVVAQFTKMNDMLDDGIDNDSQTTSAITSRDETVNGYSVHSEFYGGRRKVQIQKVLVDRMSHAWSGAYEAAQYADKKGPDASELIWTFLSNYSRK